MYNNFKFNNLQMYKLLPIFMLFGSLVGSIFSFFYFRNFDLSYFSSFNPLSSNISLFELFFKNFKSFIILWFLGLNFLGVFFIPFLIFIKGASFGIAFYVLFFNTSHSFKFLFFSYLPFYTLFLPFYFFLSVYSLKNIFNSKSCFVNYIKMLIPIFLFSILFTILQFYLFV